MLPASFEFSVTSDDIRGGWKPETEAARLYHSPFNLAIERALLPLVVEYTKMGSYYFAVKTLAEYAMYDITEASAAANWIANWDKGRPFLPPKKWKAVKQKEYGNRSVPDDYKPRRYDDRESRKK